MPANSNDAVPGVDDFIIAFMGPPGSGKSFFVDLLAGRSSQRAKDLLPSPIQGVDTYRVPYPNGEERKDIVLVDIPGFHDQERSDVEILYLISNWLRTTYETGVRLNGLIYLHSIRDNRMSGVTFKNLRMFGELCGDTAMAQVALVTTMWQKTDKKASEVRERELKADYWKIFIDQGSSIDALKDGNPQEAWRIVTTLEKRWRRKIVLLLQEELVDRRLAFNETCAGQVLYTVLREELQVKKQRMKALTARRERFDGLEGEGNLSHEYNWLWQDFRQTLQEVKTMKLSMTRKLFLMVSRIPNGDKSQPNVAHPRSLLTVSERVRPTVPNTSNLLPIPVQNILKTLVDRPPPMPIPGELDLKEIRQVIPVSAHDLDKDDIIIAVMGPTGAGKSTFIQTVIGARRDHHEIGHRLKSATSKVNALRVMFTDKDDANLVLVDTPGFDDTYKSDYEILEMIVQWLTAKRNSALANQVMRLSGILYLHRITDTRIPGSVRKNFTMFQKLCGEGFYNRVVFITTMWPEEASSNYDPLDVEECNERERHLIDKFWKVMINFGSGVYRFTRDLDSAQMAINAIIGQENQKRSLTFVQVQKEILQQLKSIPGTQAGMHLRGLMEDMVGRQSGLLDQLEFELGNSMGQDPEVIRSLLNELKDLRQEQEKAVQEMQKLKPKSKLHMGRLLH